MDGCSVADNEDEFSGKASMAVEHGEFDDEVDDDELGNAISQSSSTLSRQNNCAFPCAIAASSSLSLLLLLHSSCEEYLTNGGVAIILLFWHTFSSSVSLPKALSIFRDIFLLLKM
jgi:hypothetical protein